MEILKIEFLKLRKKTRIWLGPILVFWLIMIAYPLTVELLQDRLQIGFFSVLWILFFFYGPKSYLITKKFI